MARKNTLNVPLVLGQSLSSSFNTKPTVVINADNCAYQINVTTTDSVGTFAVQVSDDYQVDATSGTVMNPGTWVALAMSGVPTIASASDSIVIDLRQIPYCAMRLAYTSSTAGTGTCNIYVSTKQVGG